MSSTAEHATSKTRIVGVLFWTIIPSLTIWIGLYHLKSAFITFCLYHGLCLTPAIIWGRKLWIPTFTKPTRRALAVVLVVAVIFCATGVASYELIGTMVLSNEHVLDLLRTYSSSNLYLLVVLSAYIVVVNPLIEELFWRGVVLNELDRWHVRYRHFGLVWSSCSYALFHYLIFRLVLFPGFAEIGIVLLAIYGALLALVYRKTRSIVTTSLAHGLLTDLTAIALIVDLLRHHPDFMR